MATYVIRRIFQMVPVLLIVTFIVFIIFRVIPGDQLMFILGSNPDPETVKIVSNHLGLDKPLVTQYFIWITNIMHGDFGTSYIKNTPVLDLIIDKLPATLQLAMFSMILGTIIGIPAGIICGLKHNSWIDIFIRTFSFLGFSIPRYWLAILIVIFFSLNLNLIPPAGYVPFTENFLKNLHYSILPTITLALPIASEQMRFLRSSMLDVIRQDYIRTAKAKGLSEFYITNKHALKNAVIPFLTIFGLQLGFLLGGAVVVEQITAWPGIGWLTLQSINLRDYSVVQGVVLFSAFAFLTINLLVDILYTLLDPRIRYQ